jgi:hypothetical protein
MPKYWMINDRDKGGVGTSPNTTSDGLTYWVTDKTPLNVIGNWQKVTATSFKTTSRSRRRCVPRSAARKTKPRNNFGSWIQRELRSFGELLRKPVQPTV